MNSKLYVANLAYTTTDAILRSTFEQFGPITEVFIATDRETGRPRGFAFVTFESAEHAQTAMEKMSGFELEGRALTVSEAKAKEAGGGGGAPNRNFGPDRKPGAFDQRNKNRR